MNKKELYCFLRTILGHTLKSNANVIKDIILIEMHNKKIFNKSKSWLHKLKVPHMRYKYIFYRFRFILFFFSFFSNNNKKFQIISKTKYEKWDLWITFLVFDNNQFFWQNCLDKIFFRFICRVIPNVKTILLFYKMYNRG